MKILVIFLFIVAVKFLLNLYNFTRIKTLNKYHLDWLAGERDDFMLHRQEVLNLFQKAHIKNLYTPATQRIGYGKIASMDIDVFTMFPSRLEIIACPANDMFKEAEGVFRKNLFDSVNPIYWIDFILFLPKNLLLYLGLDSEKAAFKLCNILLTLIWWISGALLAFFRPDLYQFVSHLLGQFQ